MRMVNLEELIKYHPYHSSTFARYANVTTELLWAAIRGEEELTLSEILGIAKQSSVPIGVILCPKLIELNMSSYRHRIMMQRLVENLLVICDAVDEGNEDACYFVRRGGLKRGVELVRDFQNNGGISYCRYLGTLAFVNMTLGWIKREQYKPRGLR